MWTCIKLEIIEPCRESSKELLQRTDIQTDKSRITKGRKKHLNRSKFVWKK